VTGKGASSRVPNGLAIRIPEDQVKRVVFEVYLALGQCGTGRSQSEEKAKDRSHRRWVLLRACAEEIENTRSYSPTLAGKTIGAKLKIYKQNRLATQALPHCRLLITD
jgi:hypothetical protein